MENRWNFIVRSAYSPSAEHSSVECPEAHMGLPRSSFATGPHGRRSQAWFIIHNLRRTPSGPDIQPYRLPEVYFHSDRMRRGSTLEDALERPAQSLVLVTTSTEQVYLMATSSHRQLSPPTLSPLQTIFPFIYFPFNFLLDSQFSSQQRLPGMCLI